MHPTTLLLHYREYQPLWEQQGLIQVGPQIISGAKGIRLSELSVNGLQRELQKRGWGSKGVLLHYTDPFLMRPPRCVGSSNGQDPGFLPVATYIMVHPNRNPAALLRSRTTRRNPPYLQSNTAKKSSTKAKSSSAMPCSQLLRYPAATPSCAPIRELLHVGSLGPHHPRRREIVKALLMRQRVPFRHATTPNPTEAAKLYAQYALVLNIPLNQDLNHRLFEVMAAGAPQIIFGNPSLLGDNSPLAKRPDLFWAQSIDEVEALVIKLFSDPKMLGIGSVETPPYWDLKTLLKQALAP